MRRNLAILGSTGSIGRNTLEVIRQNRDCFNVLGLAAGDNIELLEKQAREFSAEVVCVRDKRHADKLRQLFPQKKICFSDQGLVDTVCHPGVDTVVSAITGTAGLPATLAAIKNNQRLCLANKETLVAAGELINRELEKSSADMIPIDSEQSAIFQGIGSNRKNFIKKIILTASGGPFFLKSKQEFSGITIKEALAHPTWSMGRKITIDSATLMNKALEIIEAYHLFRLRPGQIDVVIHPQSIIHSMVEFIDSSVMAQLSQPDMRIPILYSLTYPERIRFDGRGLDFPALQRLEFFPVDREKFSSIEMADYVLEQGKNAGAVFNAANEVAVEYFLQEKISFNQIFSVVAEILYRQALYEIRSVEDVNETINTVKKKTEDYIDKGVYR